MENKPWELIYLVSPVRWNRLAKHHSVATVINLKDSIENEYLRFSGGSRWDTQAEDNDDQQIGNGQSRDERTTWLTVGHFLREEKEWTSSQLPDAPLSQVQKFFCVCIFARSRGRLSVSGRRNHDCRFIWTRKRRHTQLNLIGRNVCSRVCVCTLVGARHATLIQSILLLL